MEDLAGPGVILGGELPLFQELWTPLETQPSLAGPLRIFHPDATGLMVWRPG